jgi:hypothetical protein
MNLLFLQDAALVGGDAALAGGLMALIMGMLAVFLAVFAVIWIYVSFAYMSIAKKNSQSMPGLSWVPLIGPSIVAFRASKMHWWPWILIAASFLPIPFLAPIFGLIAFVFIIIWNWKMLEAIGKPGWWAIFMLIFPIYLIMIGIAAWSK